MKLASTTLRTFVPSRSYETSRRFYKELGFDEKWTSNELSIFHASESQSFFVQNFYRKEQAENFMMQLMVEDLDAWWTHLTSLDLESRYEGVKMKAPHDYPWGLREIHLIDPAGVLWHITQRPSDAT